MGNEMLDSGEEFNEEILESGLIGSEIDFEKMERRHCTDARRLLDERMEEVRLRRETQEFDFNFDD